MAISHTDRLIDLLSNSPDGLPIEEIREKLNRKTNKDVQNTIQILKKKGYAVVNNNGIYRIKSINQKTYPIKSAAEKTLDLLINNPDGLTSYEIAKLTETKQNNISGRIFFLRSKGYKIRMLNDKYIYHGKLTPPIKKSVPASTGIKPDKIHVNTDLIPKHLHNSFLKLSDSDKIDCIDMLRKSLYYKQSAISLLESNERVESFVSSIGGMI